VTRARILLRRGKPGFNPNLFPSCDGRPLTTVPRDEPWLAVKRRFLDAYWRINVQYAGLRALRGGRRPVQFAQERPFLKAIERALRAKDALEDRWASRGLVATPEWFNGIAINVAFAHPGSPVPRPASPIASASVALSFAVPRRARGRK